jgi:LPXTG-motif cell wall-anchored protein
MRKFTLWAASAAALLLSVSASEAFAGLSVVGYSSGNSWGTTWTVNGAGIGNVQAPFNRIVATNAGAISYTIQATGNFNISNPSLFEDLGTGGAHLAWGGFSGGAGAWAQTNPVPSAAAANLNSTEAGGGVTNPNTQPLTFTLFFTGIRGEDADASTTNGAHYYLDFYNGSTFITRYEIKDILRSDAGGGTTQGTEITQLAVPLPTAAWAGLALLGGMGVFLVKRRRDRSILA